MNQIQRYIYNFVKSFEVKFVSFWFASWQYEREKDYPIKEIDFI